MTALDDALNSSSIVWGTHSLWAYWRETDNGDIGTNPDSISDLSSQIAGSVQISHSLDDGLPDPVTMTGAGDASGTFSATLNGRPGLTYFASGYRAFTATGQSTGAYTPGTTITCAIPNNAARGDYLVAAIFTSSGTAPPVPSGDIDPKDAWAYLGSISTAAYTMQVYGAVYYTGRKALQLQGSASFSYVQQTMAFWATNPTGLPLRFRVTGVTSAAESVSQTAHAVSSTISRGKSLQLSIWGSASTAGPWTPTSGETKWGEEIAASLDLMMAVSPLRDTNAGNLTATTTTATASAAMMAVVLEPYPRARMDGRQYFSPFNRDSPIYGFDRDTATTLFTLNTLTATGIVGTTLFSGVMSGLPVKGRQAEIDAVSATRINLNTSVTLPIVSGYREGCTVDWLASWLLSRGGRYAGPAPTIWTQAWVPLHGSTHSHIEGPYTYNLARFMSPANPGGWYGYKNPVSVAGPYVSAMYAEQKATQTKEIVLLLNRLDLVTNPLKTFQADASGGTTPVKVDNWSQANAKGRISFQLRGDTVQAAPSYMTSSVDDIIFQFVHYILDSSGNFLGYIRFTVRSADRLMEVQFGSTVAGFSTYSYSGQGALNSTGAWDFYGFQWDFAAGQISIQHNAATVTSTTYATDGRNIITQLPNTDVQGRALGHKTTTMVKSHVPMAEVMLEFGPSYSAGQWANWYPTPAVPGGTVITRPTLQWLQAVASPTPVTAWDTLASLAQAALCMYRANEDDKFEFLPLSYFGETAQMTASTVVDVSSNAQDLDVTLDPSKARNVVTLQFNDTAISTNPVTVLQLSQSTPIPKGLSILTFTLDTPIVEIHGQSSPTAAWWTLTNLTDSQITTPAIPTGVHYATVNSTADGTGTTLASTQVAITILYGDASTITLQFNNQSGAVAYLANDGQEVPFLNLLGYAVSVNDGYTTMRDSGSIGTRLERGLTTQMEWIQSRSVAENNAMLLAAMLARPRPQLTVKVMGDPRRRPGQLVTIKDAEGTQAAGTWRILSVDHDLNGAEYTQDLLLVYVGPVLNWDDSTTTWDNAVWGP